MKVSQAISESKCGNEYLIIGMVLIEKHKMGLVHDAQLKRGKTSLIWQSRVMVTCKFP